MSHIGVTDPSGKRKVYRVKSFDELTVAEWRKMTADPIDTTDPHALAVELLSRHCTIPKSVLRRMPAGEVSRLMQAIERQAEDLAKAKAEADKALDMSKFVHQGITYVIPQDLERDATFGQYEDLEKVLLPSCTTDADVHKAICAALCLPEGEVYDGSKVMARIEAFETLPMAIAVRVYAFFFGSSETFRNVMSRCISRTKTTKQPNEGQALTAT